MSCGAGNLAADQCVQRLGAGSTSRGRIAIYRGFGSGHPENFRLHLYLLEVREIKQRATGLTTIIQLDLRLDCDYVRGLDEWIVCWHQISTKVWLEYSATKNEHYFCSPAASLDVAQFRVGQEFSFAGLLLDRNQEPEPGCYRKLCHSAAPQTHRRWVVINKSNSTDCDRQHVSISHPHPSGLSRQNQGSMASRRERLMALVTAFCFCILLCLSSVKAQTDEENFFINPPKFADRDLSSNQVWKRGEIKTLKWKTFYIKYVVQMWQEDLVGANDDLGIGTDVFSEIPLIFTSPMDLWTLADIE